MQDETGHPEMIAHVDSFTGSYLEFPLERTRRWALAKPAAHPNPEADTCSLLISTPGHLEGFGLGVGTTIDLPSKSRHMPLGGAGGGLETFTCAGMTSAFVPPILMPAYKQAR